MKIKAQSILTCDILVDMIGVCMSFLLTADSISMQKSKMFVYSTFNKQNRKYIFHVSLPLCTCFWIVYWGDLNKQLRKSEPVSNNLKIFIPKVFSSNVLCISINCDSHSLKVNNWTH